MSLLFVFVCLFVLMFAWLFVSIIIIIVIIVIKIINVYLPQSGRITFGNTMSLLFLNVITTV